MESSHVIEKTNGTITTTEWTNEKVAALAHELGAEFAKNTDEHDNNDTFVAKNYELLKEHRVFTALVPKELGGLGFTHSQMCDFLRIVAGYCSSTALALSMHMHLVAANAYKYQNGLANPPVLGKVAEKQLVLISTGAKDWLESNGEMEKVEGGYLYSSEKVFASQSAYADVLVTSGPYNDPEKGWVVHHFPVMMNAEGVSTKDNWYTLGMRGTGSNTVVLDKVFVPEESIAMTRPREGFHPAYNVIAGVAMPLIMSVYLGVAEKAVEKAFATVKKRGVQKVYEPSAVGELNNTLATAQLAVQDMVRIANNYNFPMKKQIAHDILTRKTIAAKACMESVQKAMHLVGGSSFFRGLGFERLFRDVQAANYHPLAEKDQHLFSGEYLLNEA